MNYIDIVIILVIILGAFIGYQRGAVSEFLMFFGFFIIMIISFYLKNPVAVILYKKLPFFDFPGLLQGVSVINILVYELLAFFIVFIILYILFKTTIYVSKFFNRLFDASIMVSIPMKIGGAILGIVENYLVVFLVLYILSLPFFDIDVVKESKLREKILANTPILNHLVEGTVSVGKEFWVVAEDYRDGQRQEELNLETLDLLLKYKVTTVESVDVLVEENKIQINDIESVLMKYRDKEETSD